VHHLYVARSPRRDEARVALAKAGVETAVHYPHAVSDHPAFADARRGGSLEASEAAARQVVSLPCYAHLTAPEEQQVAAEIAALGGVLRLG
jgi:dTDP-4-amino-4,6-dideoxygalactose transaminase